VKSQWDIFKVLKGKEKKINLELYIDLTKYIAKTKMSKLVKGNYLTIHDWVLIYKSDYVTRCQVQRH
jgi:hypothetical protein